MSHGTFKKCVFCCCWTDCAMNVNEILSVDGVVKFFYILADFLASSPRSPECRETAGIDAQPHLWISSFSCLSFCFTYVTVCCLVHRYVEKTLPNCVFLLLSHHDSHQHKNLSSYHTKHKKGMT